MYCLLYALFYGCVVDEFEIISWYLSNPLGLKYFVEFCGKCIYVEL